MADTLILNVIIDYSDLKALQDGGYNLCFIRDVTYGGVEKKGNVVFSIVPTRNLAHDISLKWQEKYQVYGASRFEGGASVTVDTQIADIEGGQQADIDPSGQVNVSGAGQPGASFTVRNEWQDSAYIGVNNYDASTGSYASIFISPELPLNSTSDFLPIKKFSAFWDRGSTTGKMIHRFGYPPFEFDLTDSNELTLQYAQGIWGILN